MTPALADAINRAHYIYLTTYSQAGKPGTVPTWCWLHDDALYFTTQRASLKARRIRNGGRVTVPLEDSIDRLTQGGHAMGLIEVHRGGDAQHGALARRRTPLGEQQRRPRGQRAPGLPGGKATH